MRGDRFLHNNR
ncbi:hypothetical protein D018_0294A, partial [Vibrio parahaemolyticus VP2007-007]